MATERSPSDRAVLMGPGLAAIPERLLLAHARGELLFVCGAGISTPAGLSDFRQLVINVYEELDAPVHAVLSRIPKGVCNLWGTDYSNLTEYQIAEVKRFILGDYDVVLGMLERRFQERSSTDSVMRRAVAKALVATNGPAPIHRALVRLADRGGTRTIVTTNFDLLLQEACRRGGIPVETYSLGAIPRPSRQPEFCGVLHIHGALNRDSNKFSELIVSDRDFGEFYLRRRTVPDFIYDAARLYHLVLVGYSANDPPMRYLLNAVAADGQRFDDLKERFAFFGGSTRDPVALADWKARGITPIHYDSSGNHAALLATLERWAELSAHNPQPTKTHALLRRIVRKSRAEATDYERDLFDHLFRRSNASERVRLSALVSQFKAGFDWLQAISDIGAEKGRQL